MVETLVEDVCDVLDDLTSVQSDLIFKHVLEFTVQVRDERADKTLRLFCRVNESLLLLRFAKININHDFVITYQ